MIVIVETTGVLPWSGIPYRPSLPWVVLWPSGLSRLQRMERNSGRRNPASSRTTRVSRPVSREESAKVSTPASPPAAAW